MMGRVVGLIMALAAGAAADDKAALLAFKASGADPDGRLNSWDEGTSPCGEGWDSSGRGWWGVECDASGGRVTHLSRGLGGPDGVGGGARIAHAADGAVALRTGVTGSVGELASLTQLHRLWLRSTETGSVGSSHRSRS